MADRVVVVQEEPAQTVAVVAPPVAALIVTDRPQPPAVIVHDPVTTVVIPGPTERVVTITERPTVVAIASPAQGPPGPQGPPGGGGSGTSPISFTVSAVSSWSRAHTFAWLPEVRLVDAAGYEVEVGVEYPDAHQVYLEFPTPFTGTIYLS